MTQPAAYRYTEARLAAISDEMLADIDRGTVDFMENFDGRLQEPTVLPARLPNLLVNGSTGIAVGMATNIPPHNLGEICRAVERLIDQPDATVDDLCEIVTGPDFPTGGTVFRFADQRSIAGEKERIDAIRHMYATGRGRIIMRGQVVLEEVRPGRMAVVITELPYQVNKTTLIEKMADLVGAKKMTDVSDIRDESDRDGMRIVVEVKRDGSPHTVMAQLFKHTALESSFSTNMLALVDGQPQTLGLKRMLEQYIAYRREVIRRRTEFDLARAQERAHILEGLKIALDHLDEVIATIRAASDVDAARQALIKKFQPERGAGQRHPRDAASPAGGPRAQEDRGRVRGGHPASSPSWRTCWPTRARSCRSSRTSWPSCGANTARNGGPGSGTTPIASCRPRTSSPPRTWS